MDVQQSKISFSFRHFIQTWLSHQLGRERPIFEWSIFHPPQAGHALLGRQIQWRDALIDWSVIGFAILLYCSTFLDLGSGRPLPGNEAEVFLTLDRILVQSLLEDGQFPLWNPYIQAGLSWIADPFLHAFNPIATLPVLLLGVLDGFKIALFLSFLIAGLGMWWLGAVLGMGRFSRLWIALMYAFTGQAAARFIQGQYDFVLGFAWIPWSFAGLLLALRTRRKFYTAWSALFLALLFFSGNVYYAFYMLFALALLTLVELFDIQSSAPFITLDRGKAGILFVTGLLAFTLISIQFLPLIEFWPFISKATNLQLSDSQPLQDILLDFTSKAVRRPGPASITPEEFYAYTGIWPFVALLLLPLALTKRTARPLLFFGLLFGFALSWVDIKNMPWRDLYLKYKFLHQFRYPSRILIYGICSLTVLAGLGLDAGWKTLASEHPVAKLLAWWRGESPPATSWREKLLWITSTAGLLVLTIWGIWSVSDLYQTNKALTRTREPQTAPYEIARWLRQYDPSEYYVSTPGNWHAATTPLKLRVLDAWYGFLLIRPNRDLINQRPVNAMPNYIIRPAGQAPEYPGSTVIHQAYNFVVYQVPQSLPFAFAIPHERLTRSAGTNPIQRHEVTPLVPYAAGPNRVEIIAAGQPDSSLVVLMNQYPGWQVKIDGKKQSLKNIGGYLAVDLQPGIHKYEFIYHPGSFTLGLLITLLALVATAGLLIVDLDWQAAIGRIRSGLHPTPREGETGRPISIPPRVIRAYRSLGNWPLWLSHALSQQWRFFTLGLVVYAVSRFWALDQFPIYFFTDEVQHPLYAEELIKRHFRGPDGTLFPIYFEAASNRWTPLLSVYIHGLTMSLFGKSIFVTRATSAIVSLFGAAAVALILKLIFRARFWWTGVLLIAITPTWFLHSRTGFETVMMASSYALFLLFYLLYRCRSPRYLYAALPFGAATFYMYSNGQAVMGAAALLLLLSDLRYHLRHWRSLIPILFLALILAWPFLNFRWHHPASMSEHLRTIHSYWFQDIPLAAKLLKYAERYLYGLSPQYWFLPNGHDLTRHRMDHMGHIRIEMLPLFLIGLAICLRNFRSSPYRAILLAALAAPAGAAMVDIGITRVIAFVMPATILAGLGLEALCTRLPRRIPTQATATALFLLFTLTTRSMLHQALTEGPLWFRDYGLYGMQFGTKELFRDTIPQYLNWDPQAQIIVSPNWANGAHRFIPFFIPPDQRSRVRMGTVNEYLFEKLELNPNMVFVMTPQEYERARNDPKLKSVTVERIIPYPDGSPGFYFARLEYAENADELFAAEREERRRPVEETFDLDGQTVLIRHSRFDMGRLNDIFDDDRFTLARGLEANPLVLEIEFPEPRSLSGLIGEFSTMDFTLTAILYEEDSTETITYSETYVGLPNDPHVELQFDQGPHTVSRIRIEIKNIKLGDMAKIHVRTLKVK